MDTAGVKFVSLGPKPEKKYVPEIGDVLFELADWMNEHSVTLASAAADAIQMRKFQTIPLYSIDPHPYRAIYMAGIDDAVMREKSAYKCPYTKYEHYAFVPTAIFTDDTLKYKPLIERRIELEQRGIWFGVDYALDADWNADHSDLELTSVQKSILGPGYTGLTGIRDGHGRVKQGLLPLDNGDKLYVHFWEWYNK